MVEPAAEIARSPNPLQPRAVFATHGMGQQVAFETLDDIARGLCAAIERSGAKVEASTAITVRVGCETLQRLEIDLSKNGKPLAPIHLYESYWAPLTEGAVGLWQVIRFLVAGGWNGLRSNARLNRFMFGKPREFGISRWALLILAVVILAIIAMVIVGTTVGSVAIARFTFAENGWVNEELVRDLTSLFEGLLGVIAGALASAVALIALSRWILPKSGNAWRYKLAWHISGIALIPGILIVLAFAFSAYVAIPTIFLFDEAPPFPGRTDCEWCTSFGAEVFAGMGDWIASIVKAGHELVIDLLRCPIPEHLAWWVLIAATVLAFLYALNALRAPSHGSRTSGGRIAGAVFAILAIAAILAICGRSPALAFITWALLFGLMMFVRLFLIQYVGDVAIYVSPHLVDRFFDLRTRIRATVWRTARAVYACRDERNEFQYDDIVVAGHSLGSVIAYDVLNRLINEDDLSGGSEATCCDNMLLENLRVAERTRLLLTFGSPLDKTAFIFARHDPHGGSERDALAASVQPLIARERAFPWVNVYSPFDILGGSVKFYDTPPHDEDPNVKNRVENQVDPKAITPLVAHTEFWRNTLIYDRIYDALTGTRSVQPTDE